MKRQVRQYSCIPKKITKMVPTRPIDDESISALHIGRFPQDGNSSFFVSLKKTLLACCAQT